MWYEIGGYGRDICAAAMISGVSGAAPKLVAAERRVKDGGYLRADEYVPDALGVL